MKAIEQMKFVYGLAPISSNTAYTETEIDTKGWGHLRVLITMGAMTSGGTVDVKLAELDTAGGSPVDITGAAITQLSGTGGGGKLYAIDVDLTKGVRKRYIYPVAAAATQASVTGIVGILSIPTAGSFSGSATEAGLTEKISV